ncbi:MAG: ABC transporter substrate-binding protein [Sporomusaceae bacterium]|nr:ABC transporter substrate-binding protein [Sporomusaceae bacterium]
MRQLKQDSRYVVGLLLLLFAVNIVGCGPKPASPPAAGAYLIVTDDAGRIVNFSKQPQRIVPLSSSFLDLLYAVGGQAVGKPSSKTGSLPPAARELPEVGHISNINAEQLLGLRPDLVIGFQGIHEKLVPIMESSHIPFLLIKMKTYQDVQDKIELFGKLAGTEQQAAVVADGMRARIAAVTGRVPAAAKSVAILHATASSITVQLDSSIAGSIANMLRLKNIAAGSVAGNLETAPYSMEKLVEGDPDIVLITYMGTMADIEKRLRDDVKSNPAWNGLRAVKNEQVFFLPMELFLLNPGIRYDAAVDYMARVVYPDVFGSAK